ncbi:hypothetical protein Peur_031516 [Populus x canadensis]
MQYWSQIQERQTDRQELKMITVAIMAELLEEYAVALARITERLMPPRRSINGFRGLRNSRLPSSSSSSSATHDQDPCSFITEHCHISFPGSLAPVFVSGNNSFFFLLTFLFIDLHHLYCILIVFCMILVLNHYGYFF